MRGRDAAACLAARRGEVERAKDMLDPVLGHESDYYFTEWRSILMTQIELAKAQGEFGVVPQSAKADRGIAGAARVGLVQEVRFPPGHDARQH